MDNSTSVLQSRPPVEQRYRAIAQEARYGQYVRIPERICRCFKSLRIQCDVPLVQERLLAYYLFIGVVDDAIDWGTLEAGAVVLRQLQNDDPEYGSPRTDAETMTEHLKTHIGPDCDPLLFPRLEELYRAVVREHTCRNMRDYLRERERVGRLTAEVSYWLLRPLFPRDFPALCRFMEEVGEVGCLLDSVIDLRSDIAQGLLGFQPRIGDYLRLGCRTIRLGLRALWRYPLLIGVFAEAIFDNMLDGYTARRKL